MERSGDAGAITVRYLLPRSAAHTLGTGRNVQMTDPQLPGAFSSQGTTRNVSMDHRGEDSCDRKYIKQ